MKKIGFILLSLFVAALFATGGFVYGVSVGSNTPRNLVISNAANLSAENGDPADFSTFWQAWSLIDDLYLRNKAISPTEKLHGAIAGLVRSLGDDYSEYFNPEDNKKFQEDIQGNFGGIGAEIGLREGRLVIVSPLKGTPAMAAGLRAGDFIVKINETPTDGISVEAAVKKIRGKENTQVILSVFRDGFTEPKEFKITRAIIQVPTLDLEMRGNVAHIRLYNFNGNANSLFYNAVLEAANKNAQGIVLDLRSNPGGFLNVAIDLTGWFVKKGTVILTEEGVDGVVQTFRANGNESLVDIPLVVLLNKGSASASEILAGALRDIRGVKIVGETSFGKGTVQTVENLKDGSSLKLTIAHWVLPKGQLIEGLGIEPDVPVELTEEDIKKERDPQLQKALEVLKQDNARIVYQ